MISIFITTRWCIHLVFRFMFSFLFFWRGGLGEKRKEDHPFQATTPFFFRPFSYDSFQNILIEIDLHWSTATHYGAQRQRRFSSDSLYEKPITNLFFPPLFQSKIKRLFLRSTHHPHIQICLLPNMPLPRTFHRSLHKTTLKKMAAQQKYANRYAPKISCRTSTPSSQKMDWILNALFHYRLFFTKKKINK